MVTFNIEIDIDGNAFENNGWQQECAHVLTKLAARLLADKYENTSFSVYDTEAMPKEDAACCVAKLVSFADGGCGYLENCVE